MLGSIGRVRHAALALALSFALSACVVGAGPYGYYYSGGYVAIAPPAPIFEAYGPAPYPGDVWLGGYWRWSGVQYVWVRGHWAAPRPGYRWVSPRWVHHPRGWTFNRGHWARR